MDAAQHMTDDDDLTGPRSLDEFVEGMADVLVEDPGFEAATVKRFRDTGLMTSSDGLLVRFKGGAEFQVSVVKSG